LLDLHTIADDFSELSNHLEVSNRYFQHALRSLSKSDVVYLNDKHTDADAWIAADDAERVKLREAAEKKHAAVRAELARIRVVSREDYLARKRRDMKDWRDRNKPADKARQKAWRESNREYTRKHMKDFRARVKADPVAYAAEREANKLRMREKRSRWKAERIAANPPPPKPTAEEIAKRKRDWNREYQRMHPVVRTEEQMQSRRDYYRAKYHENKAKKRAA
jgi:hypothetical protein